MVPSNENSFENMGADEILRIGEFTVDFGERRIFNDDTSKTLEPKPMEVLLLLVKSNGKFVTNEKIINKVWSLTYAGEPVARAVSKIRNAFDDDAKDPRYIQNVTKKGYRLIANVKVTSSTEEPKEISEKQNEKPWIFRFPSIYLVAFSGLLASIAIVLILVDLIFLIAGVFWHSR